MSSSDGAGAVGGGSQILNVPNFLTLLRILATPLYLIFLMDHAIGTALLIFIAAGVSDSLDGAIARLTNTRTTLGAYLDPLADKALIVSSFIALAFLDVVPSWLTVIVISRDVLIVSGYLMLFVATQELMEVHPTVASKVSTFLHLCSVSVALFMLWSPGMIPQTGVLVLFVITAILTTLSGMEYMVTGLRWYDMQLRRAEPSGQPPGAP